jgi:hypothetical protein
MPLCCLYTDARTGDFRSLCTTDPTCPTLGGGLTLVGSWGVLTCEECTFNPVPNRIELASGLLGYELNEVRVRLAEVQGRLAVLARYGAVQPETIGLLGPEVSSLSQSEVAGD